ncbi:MAG: 4-oxalocrotonate tautomerase family protein [Oscillospiraceae bacterium]|nr:4-oxalocrotonate tautomerase family protein [Oscillospiraceae bacterium]
MPHITLKMLKGRTEEQKKLAAEKLSAALVEAIGCTPSHVSVSVEDFTPEEWQEQYRVEVAENDNLVLTPDYDPKELLK